MPRCRGWSCHVREPTRKVTGTAASSAERRSRVTRAWRTVLPPTSTPAIRTPLASRLGEPAKTSPRTTAARAVRAARIAVRWTSTRRWACVLGRRLLGRTSVYFRLRGKLLSVALDLEGFEAAYVVLRR